MERNGSSLISASLWKEFFSLLRFPPRATNPNARQVLLVCAYTKCKEGINGISEEKQIVFWYILQLRYCQA